MTWLPAICGVLAAAAVLILFLSGTDKKVLSACTELSGMITARGKNTSWYANTDSMLKRNGADVNFMRNINPGTYLAVRILCAVTGFFVGCIFSIMCGLILMAVMWIFPVIMINFANKKDNEEMLSDIKLVYSSLSMQIRAGINISDALLECYSCVRGRRLRKALMDLSSDIVMKSDIFSALDNFQKKFDNRYIDSLCITILQALESGQAVELLNDISEQIKDMETSVMEQKKGKLDRSITFYQLGILSAVLIVVLYACVSYMFSKAVSF
jgi:pilus assembly protein TadC